MKRLPLVLSFAVAVALLILVVRSRTLALRAANAIPANFSKSTFALAPDEALLFEHSFDLGPTGWTHLGTEVHGDALRARAGTEWSEAVLKIPRRLRLGDGAWSFYWACRTDPAAGEDGSSVHVKLRVSDDPDRHEQISVNAIVRASQRWYLFYVDPGFQKPHPHEFALVPPPGQFPDKSTVRRFRLRIEPDGTEHLLAEFRIWDETAAAWQPLTDDATGGVAAPMRIAVAADLEGHRAITALNFMFPQPAAEVLAAALAHAPVPAKSAP